MGETVAETLTQIEQTRAALHADVDALFDRLPERDVLARQAKVYGGATVGGAVAVVVLVARMKKAAESRAKRQEARIHAEELARAFASAPPTDERGSRLGALAVVAAILGAVVAYLQSREG